MQDKEIHAAIRKLTAEELDQLALATKQLYESGKITQEKAIEMTSFIVASSVERYINKMVEK